MRRRVVGVKVPDVSEDHAAFNFNCKQPLFKTNYIKKKKKKRLMPYA
jgi:hypothetical protein